MSHRTFGQTRNCAGCRFWSERVAHVVGGGPVEAMCLAWNGPQSGQYVTAAQSCTAWESGVDGPIDELGSCEDGFSICIGCGCHDEEPCPGRCKWVRLDRAAFTGVCSSCPEHVTRWDAGDRSSLS